jgi:Kef-type K+ transport system membrane component KefB
MALWTVMGGTAYVVVTLVLISRALTPLADKVTHAGKLSGGRFAWILMLLFASAWVSDAIGIHAVFGAFILGCAVPRGRLVEELTQRLEGIVTTLLVPLFFAYSGLNTRLDLLTSPGLWLVAGVVLLAACLGKGAACWAAARLTGADHPTALAVGALMNARGMMELILLNIGRERGLNTPELFSIMVVMTLATTLFASPAVEWVYGRREREAVELETAAS